MFSCSRKQRLGKILFLEKIICFVWSVVYTTVLTIKFELWNLKILQGCDGDEPDDAGEDYTLFEDDEDSDEPSSDDDFMPLSEIKKRGKRYDTLATV